MESSISWIHSVSRATWVDEEQLTLQGTQTEMGSFSPLDSSLVSTSFNSVALPTIGYDFGDVLELGTNFPTTIARNGARHAVVSGPRLGLLVDTEANGLANALANGDGADEDGVVIPSITAGIAATITVRATGSGFLNSWIDFNGDGDWNDAGERWIADRAVTGNVQLPITFPVDSPNKVFARFRITAIAGYTVPTGFAATGEVEDYLINVATSVQPNSGLALTNQGANGQTSNSAAIPLQQNLNATGIDHRLNWR